MTKTKKITTKPLSEMAKEPINYGTLGREIRVSPKANISVNKPGFSIKFYTETVEILIGIGKNHTATLIMQHDAWLALKEGEKIDITTNKKFIEKFL